MSWCQFQLPQKAWTIIDPKGQMILVPVHNEETAKHMAAQNVQSTWQRAERLGFKVVPIMMQVTDG